jgi:hypothetical protein
MDTYKVISIYRDKKNDNTLHRPGETVKLSKERGQELLDLKVVELDSSAPSVAKEKTVATPEKEGAEAKNKLEKEFKA